MPCESDCEVADTCEAALAKDPALRGRLMAATARDLLAQGQIANPAWAEIIAAIDRSLAAELAKRV